MIDGIKIKGFQSHQETYVELGAGLNVITGPSDSGKTAIMRAIKWVAFNEPAGEAFVNKAVGEAEVTLFLSNGEQITKRRKSGKTSYKLASVPEPFEKSEVPYEVAQALGIHKQSFGDFVTALNFAYQLDAPFLISETASAGAKILGKLAGTEAVDMAIKDVSKETYAARQARTQADKDIERVDAQLGAFVALDSLKEQLQHCEALAEAVETAAQKVTDLNQLKITFGRLADQIERHQLTLDRLVGIEALGTDLSDLSKSKATYDKLLALHNQLVKTQTALQQADDQLARTEGIEEVPAFLGMIDRTSSRVGVLKRLEVHYKRQAESKNTAQAVISRLGGLLDAETVLQGITLTRSRQAVLQSQVKKYDSLVDETRQTAAQLFEYDKIEEAGSVLSRITETSKEVDKMRLLASDHDYFKASVDGWQFELDRLQQLGDADSALKTVVENYNKRWELGQYRDKYHQRQLNRLAAEDKIDEAAEGVLQAKEQLAIIWEEAGGVCPICEQPVKGGHKHV